MRTSSALLPASEIAETGAPRFAMSRGFSQRLNANELRKQAVTLAECFPNISTDFIDDNLRTWESIGLPSEASDLRPVLSRESFGGGDYELAMNAVMAALREQQVMKYTWGMEHFRFLRPEPNTVLKLHELQRLQRGSIIFVPVDLSGRHTGTAALDARRYLAHDEFGLGAFEGGCFLLSQRHSLPKRGLRLMYIGDTYNPGSGADTKSCPMYTNEEHDPTSKGKIYFGRRHVEELDRREHWMIPTGFVPQ